MCIMAKLRPLLLIALLSNSLLIYVVTIHDQLETDYVHHYSWALEHRSSSAIFAFGDDTLDAGTNHYFPTLVQATLLPEGLKQFGRAQRTGRFTNGRTILDFLAELLGLPAPKPYLGLNSPLDMLNGVSYASSGSGVHPGTNQGMKVITFAEQFQQFRVTVSAITVALQNTANASTHISKAIVVICTGFHDIIGFLSKKNAQGDQFLSLESFLETMMEKMKEQVGVAYKAGALKFLFIGLPPIGCFPAFMAIQDLKLGNGHGKCLVPLNEVAELYNIALKELVLEELPRTFPGINAIMANPYNLMDSFINQNFAGFRRKTMACCGFGRFNGEGQCGASPNLITNVPFNMCGELEASEFVFWDNLHTTERVNHIVAQKVWLSNDGFVVPMNLRQLAAL